MKDLRIAAAIFSSPGPEIRQNMERMEGMIQAARSQGARLICFPEMNITGYNSKPDIQAAAEEIPGTISGRLKATAEQEEMVILAGMVEKDTKGRFFVSHLVVRPDGLVEMYRKIHIPPAEKAVFSPGNQVPLFEVYGVKFGIQLCYDAHFPELSTLMAQKGADVIFMPHASPRGTPDEKFRSWMRHLPARAYDNSLFVVACNQTGTNANGLCFPGIALSIDPSGNVMAKNLTGQEDLLIIDLTAEALDRVRNHDKRFFFPNRRPGLYERIQAEDFHRVSSNG
jgi:N-carbamoylputrescine amidase